MRGSFLLLSAIFLLAVTGCSRSQTPPRASGQAQLPPPGEQEVGRKPPMPAPVARPTLEEYRVQDFVSGLTVPWDMAFLPGGRVYVTERPGRVRLIENGNLRERPYARIANVLARGEGGLMGIAVHPDYPNPPWVYLMYTYRADGAVYNRVSRFTDTRTGLTDERPVVVRIPGASFHNGGIIRFGPDGMLYIGTGDAGQSELAQDRSSLAGKILRVTPEGAEPSDNPFPGSPVYAYGFRNIQGLAWNPENGDLWATNHGPSANDSIFIVEKGGNHGWPRVLGVTDRRGVVDPVLFFPETSIAPSRALFYTGSLMPDLQGDFFFTTLIGNHLQRVVLSGPRSIRRIERWWQTGTQQGRYGRLRALAQGPDGALYVGTSNRDGRGPVRPGDDRILRITPR
ncbi:MAG: PQQ-dependent sugar dehydrogenase [Armatimonadota bacterium]